MKDFHDLVFNPHPVDPYGVQAKMSFGNGYGVSVIQTYFSLGGESALYELALLKDGKLFFDDDQFEDVRGYLSRGEVTRLMFKIQQMPSCVVVEADGEN